jgi:hypothetical protein
MEVEDAIPPFRNIVKVDVTSGEERQSGCGSVREAMDIWLCGGRKS